MHYRAYLLFFAFLQVDSALAQGELCPSINVTVDADDQNLIERTCAAANAAIIELAHCEIAPDLPLNIRITEDLPEDCFGVFHCGTTQIDIAPPTTLARLLKPDSLFRHVPPDDFFESVVLHEIAHAAYDNTPCPYPDCPATAEYLAYAIQLSALPEEAKKALATETGITRVTRDEISAVYLAFAPDRFAIKSWVHLTSRPDPCSYARSIIAGDIVFDYIPF